MRLIDCLVPVLMVVATLLTVGFSVPAIRREMAGPVSFLAAVLGMFSEGFARRKPYNEILINMAAWHAVMMGVLLFLYNLIVPDQNHAGVVVYITLVLVLVVSDLVDQRTQLYSKICARMGKSIEFFAENLKK